MGKGRDDRSVAKAGKGTDGQILSLSPEVFFPIINFNVHFKDNYMKATLGIEKR